MAGELGKASLDLEANLGPFLRNLKEGERASGSMEHSLEALAAVSKITEDALQRIKMRTGQAAESEAVGERIEGIVQGMSREAVAATVHLHNVKMKASQAAETAAVAAEMDQSLERTTRKANETRRAMESVRIAGFGGVGGAAFGIRNTRTLGLAGLIGAGTLAAPAAGPGALGLLAGIPTLAAAGGGALGTLILALRGVGKAIGGDKKAFDALTESQQKFVLKIRSLHDFGQGLKQTAASATFPGLTGGLTAALSPGTIGAITNAVRQFGAAIGQAGLMWGRYFGSAQFQQLFGPLMQAGARTFVTLSRAALSLFDALGVLGRAAIPFTNWLTTSAAHGARWLSTFLRAKEASGGLTHALNEAKTSLRLVARLVEALWHVVFSLGRALYPVSKVFVKALTDGLNALSHMIDRNRQGIRNFVGGALKAVIGAIKDFSALVRHLSPLLKNVFDHVNALLKPFGGWKRLLEAIVLIKLGSKISGWAGSFVGLGAAAGEKGAAGKVGLLRKQLLLLKNMGLITVGVAIVLYHKQLEEWTKKALNKAHVGFLSGIVNYSGSDLMNDITGHGGGGKSGMRQMSAEEVFNSAPGKEIKFFGRTRLPHSLSGSAATDVISPWGKDPPFTKNVPKPKHPRKAAEIGDMPGYASLLSSFDKFRFNIPGIVSQNIEGSLLPMLKGTADVTDALRKLGVAVTGTAGVFDGFNLTAAEKKRHSLDARYADIYHARAGKHMTGTPGPAVYSPTFYSHDEAHQKREAKRDYFRFRTSLQTVGSG